MITCEHDLYEPVKNAIETELFELGFDSTYIEITANGQFSDAFKNFHIIEQVKMMLNNLMPDISGYIDNELLVIEIKDEALTFETIYQAKCYAELVNAKYAFLISNEDFSAKNKAIISRRNDLLRFNHDREILVGIFDIMTNTIKDWYPRRPW